MVEVAIVSRAAIHRTCVVATLLANGVSVVDSAAHPGEFGGRFAARVILLDVTDDSDGYTTVRFARTHLPDAAILVFGIDDRESEVVAYAEAGAVGYVTRDASLTDLLHTIDSVGAGEMPCPPRVSAALSRRLAEIAACSWEAHDVQGLSPRELEIVGLLERGLSNRAIARELCLALPTVKNHVHNLLDKLGVHTRRDAATRARGYRASTRDDTRVPANYHEHERARPNAQTFHPNGDQDGAHRSWEGALRHARSIPETGAVPTERSPRMKARDIMHSGAECIGENENMLKASRMMRDLNVGSLPICGEDDRLHGMITDRDIVLRCCAEGRDPANMLAKELAQEEISWVHADADIGEALQLMEQHRIRRMPVIQGKRLVGMISEGDLARNLHDDRLAHFIEAVSGNP